RRRRRGDRAPARRRWAWRCACRRRGTGGSRTSCATRPRRGRPSGTPAADRRGATPAGRRPRRKRGPGRAGAPAPARTAGRAAGREREAAGGGVAVAAGAVALAAGALALALGAGALALGAGALVAAGGALASVGAVTAGEPSGDGGGLVVCWQPSATRRHGA